MQDFLSFFFIGKKSLVSIQRNIKKKVNDSIVKSLTVEPLSVGTRDDPKE
jgi:hypothetical protein